MPHIYDSDHHPTNAYIPKISLEPYTPIEFVSGFVNLECRSIHEGRVLDPPIIFQSEIKRSFRTIKFDCLLKTNEKICPYFILEFFHAISLIRNKDRSLSLWFCI